MIFYFMKNLIDTVEIKNIDIFSDKKMRFNQINSKLLKCLRSFALIVMFVYGVEMFKCVSINEEFVD